MKQSFRRSYSVIAVLFAVFAALFRTFIAINYTDRYGVYTRNTPIVHILDIVVFVAVAAFALIPFIFSNSFKDKTVQKPTKLSVFACAELGFMFIATSSLSFFNMVSQVNFPIKQTIMAITGILGGIGFIMNIFLADRQKSLRSFFSFMPIIWSLTCLFEVYFDMDILITSPNRAYAQTALLAMALFFLANSREMLGICEPRLFFAGATTATVLCTVCALPNILCSRLLAQGPSDKPETYVVMLAVALYAAVYLLKSGFESNNNPQ